MARRPSLGGNKGERSVREQRVSNRFGRVRVNTRRAVPLPQDSEQSQIHLHIRGSFFEADSMDSVVIALASNEPYFPGLYCAVASALSHLDARRAVELK